MIFVEARNFETASHATSECATIQRPRGGRIPVHLENLDFSFAIFRIGSYLTTENHKIIALHFAQ